MEEGDTTLMPGLVFTATSLIKDFLALSSPSQHSTFPGHLSLNNNALSLWLMFTLKPS
jgi:hypothetical protein